MNRYRLLGVYQSTPDGGQGVAIARPSGSVIRIPLETYELLELASDASRQGLRSYGRERNEALKAKRDIALTREPNA